MKVNIEFDSRDLDSVNAAFSIIVPLYRQWNPDYRVLVEKIPVSTGLTLTKTIHEIQTKILEVAKVNDLNKLGYRKIGKLIGVDHPQKVKHHIMQLQKKGLL